ncbi:MAG: YcaO-like family protein, partial [Desulfovibrio sp.]|nr:YcaO-like family protein [Desulfovibrio sp.]
MRHEASLSPIALLRKWRIDCRADTGRNSHTLAGEAIAYGRGLSLAAARTACLMETVERVCSYPSIETTAAGAIVRNRKNNGVLTRAAPAELRAAGRAYWHPPTGCDIDLYPFYWLPGETPAGDQIMIPAQAVFLFCNLDEETIFDGAGSTGLATGATLADARLAALTEVLERESDALAPASRAREFILESRDLRIRELLSDYRFRGINILMRDIGEAGGLPIYRCETRGRNGKCASASAANLNGASAALAALTETPWPYSWSNPQTRSEPTIPPRPGTPVRYLEDLPNYDLGSAEANLAMLEEWLAINGRRPVYVDISREDLDFPV